MNKVEELFSRKAIKRRDLILYNKNDSLAFIKECENVKISILGIDGFILKDDTIQPSLENSIDFSASTSNFINNRYEEALSLIHKANNELFFEIICE